MRLMVMHRVNDPFVAWHCRQHHRAWHWLASAAPNHALIVAIILERFPVGFRCYWCCPARVFVWVWDWPLGEPSTALAYFFARLVLFCLHGCASERLSQAFHSGDGFRQCPVICRFRPGLWPFIATILGHFLCLCPVYQPDLSAYWWGRNNTCLCQISFHDVHPSGFRN